MVSFPRRRLVVVLALALSIPFTTTAQTPTPPTDPVLLEQLSQTIDSARSECLDYYDFGSVFVDFGDDFAEPITSPGDTVSFSGTLVNYNSYPLPEARVFVRIVRQDAAVKDEHWHPIVDEFFLEGDYSLRADEERSFTTTWHVPESTPAGLYTAEFSYLAGGRYAMAGLPYLSNFPAGSATFVVSRPEGEAGNYLNFDRSSVRLNDTPFALRAIPPTLPLGEPISIAVDLSAETSLPVDTTVTAQLYTWSSTDGQLPLQSDTNSFPLAPGETYPLQFTWDSLSPGVYELVLRAETTIVDTLPSVIRVRFPIEGNVPRIIYSGIGDISEEETLLITCSVNGTRGVGTGEIYTGVSIDNNEIATETIPLKSDLGGAVHIRVPTEAILAGKSLRIAAETRDENGTVTDSHTLTYDVPRLLTSSEDEPAAVAIERPSSKRGLWPVWGLLLLLLLSLLIFWVWRKQQKAGAQKLRGVNSFVGLFLFLSSLLALSSGLLAVVRAAEVRPSCRNDVCHIDIGFHFYQREGQQVGHGHTTLGLVGTMKTKLLQSSVRPVDESETSSSIPSSTRPISSVRTVLQAGVPAHVSIEHSGEVASEFRSVSDSPPIFFKPDNVVELVTTGASFACSLLENARPQSHPDQLRNFIQACLDQDQLDTGPIRGAYEDRWQSPEGVGCTSLSPDTARCTPPSDTFTGTAKITLQRVIGKGFDLHTPLALHNYFNQIISVGTQPNFEDATMTSSVTIEWAQCAPIITPRATCATEPLVFDGSQSTCPRGNRALPIAQYEWEITDPDGSTSSAAGATTTISSTNPGTYSAALTVTDSDGITGRSETLVTLESCDSSTPDIDSGEIVTTPTPTPSPSPSPTPSPTPSSTPTTTPTTTPAVTPYCGDGVVDTDVGEQCDDGKHCDTIPLSCNSNEDCIALQGDETATCAPREGDSCNAECQWERPTPPPSSSGGGTPSGGTGDNQDDQDDQQNEQKPGLLQQIGNWLGNLLGMLPFGGSGTTEVDMMGDQPGDGGNTDEDSAGDEPSDDMSPGADTNPDPEEGTAPAGDTSNPTQCLDRGPNTDIDGQGVYVDDRFQAVCRYDAYGCCIDQPYTGGASTSVEVRMVYVGTEPNGRLVPRCEYAHGTHRVCTVPEALAAGESGSPATTLPTTPPELAEGSGGGLSLPLLPLLFGSGPGEEATEEPTEEVVVPPTSTETTQSPTTTETPLATTVVPPPTNGTPPPSPENDNLCPYFTPEWFEKRADAVHEYGRSHYKASDAVWLGRLGARYEENIFSISNETATNDSVLSALEDIAREWEKQTAKAKAELTALEQEYESLLREKRRKEEHKQDLDDQLNGAPDKGIEGIIPRLDKEIEALEAKQDALEPTVPIMENRVTTLTDRLRAVRDRLTEIESQEGTPAIDGERLALTNQEKQLAKELRQATIDLEERKAEVTLTKGNIERKQQEKEREKQNTAAQRARVDAELTPILAQLIPYERQKAPIESKIQLYGLYADDARRLIQLCTGVSIEQQRTPQTDEEERASEDAVLASTVDRAGAVAATKTQSAVAGLAAHVQNIFK